MASPQAESLDATGLRLAELIGAMSLAVDLGLGQPTEHVLRASLIGLRLADRLGLDEEEHAAICATYFFCTLTCAGPSHSTPSATPAQLEPHLAPLDIRHCRLIY